MEIYVVQPTQDVVFVPGARNVLALSNIWLVMLILLHEPAECISSSSSTKSHLHRDAHSRSYKCERTRIEHTRCAILRVYLNAHYMKCTNNVTYQFVPYTCVHMPSNTNHTQIYLCTRAAIRKKEKLSHEAPRLSCGRSESVCICVVL